MASLRSARFQLTVGLLLVAAFWWIQWQPERFGRLGPGPYGWRALLGDIGFFGLWLGYIVTVDAVVRQRLGSSLLTRNPGRWAGAFILSVPGWWLFEYLNQYLDNWAYLGVETYSVWSYALFASLSFSTVTPAVFETAELVASVWSDRAGADAEDAVNGDAPEPGGGLGPRAAATAVAAGFLLLVGLTQVPDLLYPAAWLWAFLLFDAVNGRCGWPSLLGDLANGRWRRPGALAAAALVCGFFWELWNIWAYPKWIYRVPVFADGGTFDAPKLFEMPLPGYLGYLPFGLEVFALFVFLAGVAGRPERGWLQLGSDARALSNDP